MSPNPVPPVERFPMFGVIISGVSLFLVTAYAPFAIGAFLSDRMPGLPLGLIVSAVFLSMAIATSFSCAFTKTGLVVGPAVGLASFVGLTKVETISTFQFLLASFIAGVLAVMLSWMKAANQLSLRQNFLDNLPEPVKIGVRGGVGTLLASAAIHGLEDIYEHARSVYPFAIKLFVVGVLFLLATEVAQEKLEQKRGQAGSLGIEACLQIARAANGLLPLILLFVFYEAGVFRIPDMSLKLQLPLTWPPFPIAGAANTDISNFILTICFAFVILFVFLTDIPGSPYDLLKKAAQNSGEVGKIIDKSFWVTSFASMLNPLLGLHTSVYYAENHAIVRQDEDDAVVLKPATGWICCVLFFVAFVGFLVVQVQLDEIKRWLLISLAPSLFTIGVRMTARALGEEANVGTGSKVLLYYKLPAALTLVLTHEIGLELALPIGIVYYGLYHWIYGSREEAELAASAGQKATELGPTGKSWFFAVLVGISAGIALILGGIRLGYG